MGKNQSKEETVIVQSGNSGGTSATTVSEWRVADIFSVMVFILVALSILLFCMYRCKKGVERRIRREVTRSREQVV